MRIYIAMYVCTLYIQCLSVPCRSTRCTSSCRHVRISYTVHRSLCLCIYILGMMRCSALWAWVVVCTMNPVSVLLGERWLAFVCRTLQGTHTHRAPNRSLQVTPFSCSVCAGKLSRPSHSLSLVLVKTSASLWRQAVCWT